MLTIVFYGSNGEAAKIRSRQIAAHKPNKARVYDALVWNGEQDFCDAVEILPCVPEWRRDLIEQVFAGRVVNAEPQEAIAYQEIGTVGDVVIPKRRGRPPLKTKQTDNGCQEYIA